MKKPFLIVALIFFGVIVYVGSTSIGSILPSYQDIDLPSVGTEDNDPQDQQTGQSCQTDSDCDTSTCNSLECPSYKCIDNTCMLIYPEKQGDYKTMVQLCQKGGGTWKDELPTSCRDNCGMTPENGAFCDDALSPGCDCGAGRCWNGRGCIKGSSSMN